MRPSLQGLPEEWRGAVPQSVGSIASPLPRTPSAAPRSHSDHATCFPLNTSQRDLSVGFSDRAAAASSPLAISNPRGSASPTPTLTIAEYLRMLGFADLNTRRFDAVALHRMLVARLSTPPAQLRFIRDVNALRIPREVLAWLLGWYMHFPFYHTHDMMIRLRFSWCYVPYVCFVLVLDCEFSVWTRIRWSPSRARAPTCARR